MNKDENIPKKACINFFFKISNKPLCFVRYVIVIAIFRQSFNAAAKMMILCLYCENCFVPEGLMLIREP